MLTSFCAFFQSKYHFHPFLEGGGELFAILCKEVFILLFTHNDSIFYTRSEYGISDLSMKN